MYRFFAPRSDFHADHVLLTEGETHHLRDVLRLRPGDEVHVFDGEGNEYHCLIESVTKKETKLKFLREIRPEAAESDLDLTLASTVLNGEKFDLVVQKAVELGVTRLVPLHTKRCEVRAKDAVKRTARWRKIALDAAKQCGRATLMTVNEPTEFLGYISNPARPGSLQILFSERDGGKFESLKVSTQITAFFGPKGGWEDDELAAARQCGIQVVTLGGRILRAETAAISITAILQHRFGDMR